MNDKSFTCRCAEKPPQIASLGLEFRVNSLELLMEVQEALMKM